jgi:hypothetical protein
MEVPQLFTLALPIIVAPLVGWLNNPRMPEWLRCLIAAVVIVAVAALWAVYVHALTNNVVDDFILVASYCSVLSTTLLLPLYKLALVHIPSPFAAFFKPPTILTPPTVRGPLTPQ